MTDYPAALEVEARSGAVAYRGVLWQDGIQTIPPEFRKPISIGLSPTPKEYGRWFQAIEPGRAAFARVFSPPGAGLPDLQAPALRYLPQGTQPWISHKDEVPLDQVTSFWEALRDRYKPITGLPLRWTFSHERAPAGRDTLYDYRAYWHRLVDVAADYPWIQLVQIQSGYAMRWRADTDWREWMIYGVSLGFDVYPPEFGDGYEPPESIFGLLMHAADEIGAPSWGVPELGAEVRERDTQRRADWIRACVTLLDARGADFVGLWCSSEERDKKRFDYRPTDPPTLAAFTSLLTTGTAP